MNTMYNPPHPGKLLQQLWLEPLNLSITDAARHLKVSRKTLSEIVNGKSAVSCEMAVRLEQAFGKSAESWLGHQADYDLWQLQSKTRHLGIERMATSIPVAG